MTQKATAGREERCSTWSTPSTLAGRCTECGECERVCPMGIPLVKLKKKINMDMMELFGYVAGTDPEENRPFSPSRHDEEQIEEHKLS